MTLERSTDARQADWIVHALRTDYTLGMILPPDFDAYARLLHPIADDITPSGRIVRWRDVAAEVGSTIHPMVQFSEMARGKTVVPRIGSLPLEDAHALVDTLRPFAQDQCWFCFWQGYGFFDEGSDDSPVVRGILDRRYFLYAGRIDDALALTDWPFNQTPNIWWPSNRQWCVATEVDLDSTYVGGRDTLINALVMNASLEALRVTPDDSITADSDIINAR